MILYYSATGNTEYIAQELAKQAKRENVKVKAHVKLDTGMSRIGFQANDENASLVKKISEMGYKDITVASSSLSNAHGPLVQYIKDGTVTALPRLNDNIGLIDKG